MMRFLRRVLILVCLAALGGGAYWYLGPGQSQQAKQGQQKKGPGGGFRRGGGNANDTVPVLAIAAKLADVPVYLDGVGSAKALNTVLVRPQVDGKLMKIAFKEGQEVQQGSVIAKIDPTTYQALYDIAVAKKAQDEATLANAKLDLERYMRLAASNAVQKQQVDTQRALVDQLTAQTQSDQASINNAKATLDYTNVVAPITGLTGIRQVDEGNIVHASDATGIVTLTQIKPIAVLFNLPQQNLPDLNKGMAAGQLPVQAIGADGTTVVDSGKVVVINNQVDQTTGTVQIKGEFPNANTQLWPGQFVNIRLLINTLKQSVVVPTAAVQRGPDGTFVYVVKEDSSVAVRPVMVQQQDDLQAVIASGLMAAERVVTTGFGRLAEGTKVEVTSAEDAGQIITDPAQRPARPGGGGNPKGQGQGKGQRQQNPANAPAAPGAAAPGSAAPGAAAPIAGAPETGAPGAAPAPSPEAGDTRPPGQRRGGASKGPEQPTQAAGGPPSPTP